MQQGLHQLLGKNRKIFLALVTTGGGGEENWENTNSDSWKQKYLSICGWRKSNRSQHPVSAPVNAPDLFLSGGGKKKIKAIDLKVLRWSWDSCVSYQQLITAFPEMYTFLCKSRASYRNCRKAWLKLPYCWELTVGFTAFLQYSHQGCSSLALFPRQPSV